MPASPRNPSTLAGRARRLCAIDCHRTDDTDLNRVLALNLGVPLAASDRPWSKCLRPAQTRLSSVCRVAVGRFQGSQVPRFVALAAVCARARADAALALETGHYHPPSVSHASGATANPYLYAEGRTRSMIHAASGRLPTVRRHGPAPKTPPVFQRLSTSSLAIASNPAQGAGICVRVRSCVACS